MYIIGEILRSLAYFADLLFRIVYFLVVIRIILSWFSINPYNEIIQALYRITDPILAPFRRLPLQFGPIDFSPVLAFIVLKVIGDLIYRLLMHLSARFM